MDNKEGKFYWLKLKKDFFKRHDIRIVEDMPNGKDYILFYLKMLVESVDHEGELRFSDSIPYNEQMLATITNTNVDLVRSAMQVFTSLNMIEVMDDQTIFMSEVQRMIGSAVDNDNANRQRRFRERKKEEITESVTKCNAGVTQTVTKDNESKSIELEKELELEKESKPKKTRFIPPTIDEVRAYCAERQNGVDPERFVDFYASKNWMVGKNKMVDWKACVRTWEQRNKSQSGSSFSVGTPYHTNDGVDWSRLVSEAEERAERRNDQ